MRAILGRSGTESSRPRFLPGALACRSPAGTLNGMDARRKEIDRLQKEIQDLEEQLKSECVDIGARLQRIDIRNLHDQILQKYLRNMEALVKTREDLNAQIDRIHRLTRRIQQKRREIEEGKERLSALEEEQNRIASDVGAGAYRLYRTMPDGIRYRRHFEEILKVEAQIEQLRRELSQVEEEDKKRGFFGRLVSRGRTMGIRSAIAKQEKIKAEKYASAGRSLAESDFVKHTEGELKYQLELITQRRREMDEIQARMARLEEEAETLRADLRSLAGGEDGTAKIREIETRIASTNKELNMVQLWAGKALVEQGTHASITDPMVKGKATLVESLKQVIDDKRRRSDRLRAEMELEGLRNKLKALRRKKEQIESEIHVRQMKMQSLNSEIGKLEKRVSELQDFF